MAAVILEGVSKKFTMHYDRPHSFQEAFLSLLRRGRRNATEEFWALRDASFEIAHGETVGVIGPNGAGKSTVLKLISRIIEPTSGRIQVNGRVGALLELGAGFHPDLTGRENIYLNGSIMGLSQAQIRRKLDEIVAFAELERFIDVPVRHYSSGMYVRLGFSVAVHTEPEILLIDEVLAVGDQNFQHKCLDRIMSMQQQGITICYISHDLATVQRLCSHAVWLQNGLVQADGDVTDTVSSYLRYMSSQEDARMVTQKALTSAPAPQTERRWGTGEAQITSVSFLDAEGRERSVFHTGETWTARIHYRCGARIDAPTFGLAIHRTDGVHVCGPNTELSGLDIPFIEGEGDVSYHIASLPLLEGAYWVSVAIHNRADTAMYDYHDRLYMFSVRQVEQGEKYGLVSMRGEWQWNASHQP